MTHFSIDFPQISLAFTEVGTGENILLCAHGYRQSKNIFTQLFDIVPKGWKILAFDQAMHGQSTWENEKMSFDTDFFTLLWQKLITRYPQAQWHLMGFSMGGKTAMMLQETAPIKIHSMFFIAPAGVITHPLTHFFSYHFLGTKIFAFFLKNPNLIVPVLDFLHEKKLMRLFSYRFAKAQFEAENRHYMLKFIPIYRKFHVHFEKYAHFLSQKDIKIHVLWGENDEVLPVKQAYHFQKHLPKAKLTILSGQKHNFIESDKILVSNWLQQILATYE